MYHLFFESFFVLFSVFRILTMSMTGEKKLYINVCLWGMCDLQNTYLYIHIYILFIFTSMYVCMHARMYVGVYVCIYLPTYLSFIYLSIYLPVYHLSSIN